MNAAWETASKDGDVQTIRDFLAKGADIDARDRYGQTALMLAAHAGHYPVVETLLAQRADLDVTAKFGLSALMLAIVSGHVEIAHLLAKAGADLSLRGSGVPGFAGMTAYDLAVARGMRGLSAELKSEDKPLEEM